MLKIFQSTPNTQSESEKLLDKLTTLIKEGQYDAFRKRMVTLTDKLGECPTLFSALLVEVIYYLHDRRELRSRFYPDLIKYTAP